MINEQERNVQIPSIAQKEGSALPGVGRAWGGVKDNADRE